MQTRRSNRERTDATRAALLESARGLFVQRGYAETSTPDLCAAAGITRGALYHHFVDKRDLFRAVVASEARLVRDRIAEATPGKLSPRQALLAGGDAYLDAMSENGRTRLLLIDGPAVLGLDDMRAIDDAHAAAALSEGLAAAGLARNVPVAPLASLLSAAFDRAALDLAAGQDPKSVRKAMRWLLQRVIDDDGAGATAARRSRR
ncbi:MAG TPA: helix-turn-helix domain-containing protein [Tahibacter sp.]|uniref:TetR/AcrR family transcriptional regulator n=1 Tax=Tahibacter sp. TaxID=2056211 RepID=UPI002B7D9BA7|nr:helix-turn-helix domain-containing protein [Tahibacter sp.]HSX60887.1 helix-turn-helix domain-containing protein [Tahibacter sp.]